MRMPTLGESSTPEFWCRSRLILDYRTKDSIGVKDDEFGSEFFDTQPWNLVDRRLRKYRYLALEKLLHERFHSDFVNSNDIIASAAG